MPVVASYEPASPDTVTPVSPLGNCTVRVTPAAVWVAVLRLLNDTVKVAVGTPLTNVAAPEMVAATSARVVVVRVRLVWSGAKLAPCDDVVLVAALNVELPAVVGAVKANDTTLVPLATREPTLGNVMVTAPVPSVPNAVVP